MAKGGKRCRVHPWGGVAFYLQWLCKVKKPLFLSFGICGKVITNEMRAIDRNSLGVRKHLDVGGRVFFGCKMDFVVL